jgi:branched-chain amino acid transport system permease protein
MIFRPQGFLGMKEFSFVNTFDRIAARLSHSGSGGMHRGKKTAETTEENNVR